MPRPPVVWESWRAPGAARARSRTRIVVSRAATGPVPGRARRTLKTGYCDRKIDERQHKRSSS